MQTTVKAGGDVFIMVIVGLFWVIAQIAGSAAKKKNAPSRPTFDERGESADAASAAGNAEGLADLMRKLSGVQEFNAQQPSGPPRNELRSIAKKPTESAHPLWGTAELGDQPKTTRAVMKPKPVLPPAEVSAMSDPAPAMSAFRKSMPSIKMPTLDLNFQTLEKTGGNVPTFGKLIDLTDKQSVRRAMLNHIIFSKPKAMEGWNARHAG